MAEELFNFEIPKDQSSIIKVIGVGGGGSNAVNHMFVQGIKDVNFVVCNTDAQALLKSPVPVKIQLGESLTEGRGAGNKPEQGRQSAIENLNDIVEVLSKNTKMVFITAGMGGGTGTGAAPVIAKAARDMGILTVAIVTIPFRFEGARRINQALQGIGELKEQVDSLLVINNEKLREIYGDLKLSNAFGKADDVLTIAAKGIAEIITVHGYINVDFADVQTVMSNSGVAIMGSGKAEGEDRAIRAIESALTSPLLNNNNINGARNILLNITSGSDEITMDEVGVITDYIQNSAGQNADIIWGNGNDESLGKSINVTIIATGFATGSIHELMAKTEKKKEVVKLDDKNKTSANKEIFELKDKPAETPEKIANVITTPQRKINFEKGPKKDEEIENKGLFEEYYGKDKTSAKPGTKDEEKAEDRINNLKKSYDRLKELSVLTSKKNIDDLENEPAYKRKQVNIDTSNTSGQSNVSKYSLSENEENKTILREDNPYLHDNVD